MEVDTMEWIVLGLLFLLIVVLLFLHSNNKKLEKKIAVLQEVLEVKDTTISNLQASRVAVKDVLENLSAHGEVMKLIDAGESRESVSQILGIPVNKIELIVKFDKIKKDAS